jgi:probable addiction module antidote protein
MIASTHPLAADELIDGAVFYAKEASPVLAFQFVAEFERTYADYGRSTRVTGSCLSPWPSQAVTPLAQKARPDPIDFLRTAAEAVPLDVEPPVKLVAFEAARYLDDTEAVAEYVTAMLGTNDPDLLLLALGDLARAKGMAQVAKDAGLGRESLYKALAPGAKPRFDIVMKVARALGVKLTAHPA